MKNALTTFEAAKYCNTTMTSIARWIKAGKLKSYTTPGGHRRILREDLFEFMDRYNIPIPDDIEPVRKRILIVDDDTEIRNNLLKVLTEERYRFDLESAKDGFEAAMKVMQFKPDVIIFDMELDSVDGLDICERVKNDSLTRNIKIILYSSPDDAAKKVKALKKGADKFLTKPISGEDLIKEIKTLI